MEVEKKPEPIRVIVWIPIRRQNLKASQGFVIASRLFFKKLIYVRLDTNELCYYMYTTISPGTSLFHHSLL